MTVAHKAPRAEKEAHEKDVVENTKGSFMTCHNGGGGGTDMGGPWMIIHKRLRSLPCYHTCVDT